MNKEKKCKIILISSIIIFFIISLISIYSASTSFVIKQLFWYIIGLLFILILKNKNIEKIIKYSYIIYIILNLLLLFLLFFGKEINGSKCWLVIPKIGSFQPSEFMKICLILINTKILTEFENKYPKRTLKEDLIIFLVIFIITLIPSILTFLEPDTGMVLIYFIISFTMLFIFGIKKSIFLILLSIASIFLIGFIYFYFNYQTKFINIFGTSFFYRINRLLDWSNKSGMQLTNALAAIKAAGIKGYGIGNTPIYIPESHTDFIFSIYSNNTGFIGTIILILTIVIFDTTLLYLSKNAKTKNERYIILGFLSILLYQQIQNIGMNIGLLPITGITLPFISYGGSSLLSYMLIFSIILNYNETKKSSN